MAQRSYAGPTVVLKSFYRSSLCAFAPFWLGSREGSPLAWLSPCLARLCCQGKATTPKGVGPRLSPAPRRAVQDRLR